MIKVSVLYPNADGCRFDMAYYRATHMPLVERKLGAACRRTEIDHGIGGAAPGSKPPFVAAAHLFFDSVEAFQQAFEPHAEAIMSDVPNYTNVEPVVQISELA